MTKGLINIRNESKNWLRLLNSKFKELKHHRAR